MRYPIGMRKRKAMQDVARALRGAIAESGVNRFQLAKRTGLPYSAVHAFLANEKRDIAASSVTKILKALGLTITIQPSKPNESE